MGIKRINKLILMENLDIDFILDRENIKKKIVKLLLQFEQEKQNITVKRGFYIYGQTGSGKTVFINNILKKLDYDCIRYDAGNVRNRSVIEKINRHHISENNIVSLFKKKKKNDYY